MTPTRAIYEGRVIHDRRAPVAHRFEVPLYLLYLDLDGLETAFDGTPFWSTRRAAPARFRRRDYFGDTGTPLDDAIRDHVAERTGRRPTGAVHLLASVCTWGYGFNPAAFYYCYDRDGSLAAVVTEITNTPWGERHTYVVIPTGDRVDASFDKAFHVSPFMDMDLRYRWRFSVPGDRLSIAMENYDRDDRFFHVALTMTRREMTPRALNTLLLRYPAMTTQVIARIYVQAFRLWVKRAPFYSHPRKRTTRSETTT